MSVRHISGVAQACVVAGRLHALVATYKGDTGHTRQRSATPTNRSGSPRTPLMVIVRMDRGASDDWFERIRPSDQLAVSMLPSEENCGRCGFPWVRGASQREVARRCVDGHMQAVRMPACLCAPQVHCKAGNMREDPAAQPGSPCLGLQGPPPLFGWSYTVT